MATDIVGSLFGVNPQAYQQARDRLAYAQDYQTVQLDPLQQANLALRQGGRGLGQVAGGLLGMQDPELAKVSAIKQLSSQFDLTTPTGMREFAGALQQIAPNEAMMAAKRADELEQAGLTRKKTTADIELQERKVSQDEKLREALSKLPENATDAQYLQVFRQFGSPDQQARAIESSIGRRERLEAKAKGEGVGVAGPVGKSGAYRDADGIVYSATEMAKQRAGFQGLEKLADTLNTITPEDVKNAESFFDYTQGETLKTIGGKISPKTISAQSKINASQLLKQIESLPPGSASNADMIAAKSSFPGYGNADNLNKWIRDTKQLLASSMQRQSEQYGFKQKVQVKGLDGAAPPEPKGAPKTRTLKSGVVVTVQE
jgi:hypothetical protein